MNKNSNNSKWLLLCIALIGLTYDVYIICTFDLLLVAEKCVIYTSLVSFCLQLLMLFFDKRLNLVIFIHTVVFVAAYYVIRQEYWWYLVKYDRNSMYYVLIAIFLMILIVSVSEEKLKKGESHKKIYSYIYIIALAITCVACIYPFYEKVDVKRMDKYYEMDFLLASTDNSVIFVDKGSPVVCGMSENEKKCIESWEDIIKVEAYGNDVYGLSEAGEIFYHGENKKIENEVKKWKNIRDIAAGDGYILALGDGLMAVGDKASYECAYEEIKKIDAKMIKQIETVGSDIILLKSDGTVSMYGKIIKYYFDSEQWQDIRYISGGSTHLLGVKNDGRILAIGENFAGQCSVDGMRNVVYGYAGERNTVLILANGDVIAIGVQKDALAKLMEYSDVRAITDSINFVYADTKHGKWCSSKDIALGLNK